MALIAKVKTLTAYKPFSLASPGVPQKLKFVPNVIY